MHLWRHPNGTFYVRYGRRRLSTATGDRRLAEQFLARFISLEGRTPGKQYTVGEILDGYCTDKALTVRAPAAIRFAVLGLQPLDDLLPAHLTPPVIRRWAGSRGVSNGTVLREVGVLRAALAWAAEHQWISSIPAISNPVPTPKPRQRWVTQDEARRLLAGCREPHVRLFITLGLMTVARTGAILDARWDQVDWYSRTIDYGDGHGNKQRAVVPLNDEVFSLLQAAKQLACSPYIVEFRGQRLVSIKRGFEAACVRAQLADVTPHILRHSGATWMAMAGVPLSEIARMLGDSETMVEKVYAKKTPDYLRRAAGALQLGSVP